MQLSNAGVRRLERFKNTRGQASHMPICSADMTGLFEGAPPQVVSSRGAVNLIESLWAAPFGGRDESCEAAW